MPLALAAPELLIILGLALLLVVLLVAVQLYANAQQARSFALNLPVIATPSVTAIDVLAGLIVAGSRVVDSAISAMLANAVRGFGRLVVLSFNAAGTVILLLIHDTARLALAAAQLVDVVYYAELPKLVQRLKDLEALEGAVSQAVQVAIGAAIAVALAPVTTALGALRATQAAQAAVVDTYRPLWDSLAALPGGAARTILLQGQAIQALQAQVGVLERELVNTGAGVSALERTIAGQQATILRLTALLTLAGAGALVLENVLRLGRDPCYCLTSGGFSDLPGRVEALENFGA